MLEASELVNINLSIRRGVMNGRVAPHCGSGCSAGLPANVALF